MSVMSTSSTAIFNQSAISVLVVSPDRGLREELLDRLKPQRWHVRDAASGAEALQLLEMIPSDIVLLDSRLPDLDPEEFCGMLLAQFSEIEIVRISSYTGQPVQAATSNNSPADELRTFLSRPNTLPSPALGNTNTVRGTFACRLPGVAGSSASMSRLCEVTTLVAGRNTTVLITGETGTGKDLVAQAIHTLSPRHNNPFVVINCAAIPESLLEAELFGYAKGAFTGASQSRIGRIHAAAGGTLFLDEIGELPIHLQSKLLRFLEQGELQRLGSSDTVRVDVRVVAATNSELRKAVKEGHFRD